MHMHTASFQVFVTINISQGLHVLIFLQIVNTQPWFVEDREHRVL